MKFSYSAAWGDAVQMLRGNSSVLLALAGVFFFLPALLVGQLIPQPEGAQTLAQMVTDLRTYFSDNWHWLLLANLINAIGTIAIYLLLFAPRDRTVGSAIAGALPILPFYYLLSIVVFLSVGFGLLWFIVPGLYLLGRLVLSGPVMVAENRRSPFTAIGGSWARTRGNGWAVAGLVVMVFVAAYLLFFAVTAVLGSVFLLIGGREGVGGLLVLILQSACTAALSTVLIVLFAAIYRALATPAAASSGI
jgi:hypothetical protein